jgi:2'-5' RNA ligase
MAFQTPFLDFLPSQENIVTCFLAALPQGMAAEQMMQMAQGLRGEYALDGIARKPGQLHASLVALGTFDGLPKNLLADVADQLERIRLPQFQVQLNHVLSFRSKSRVSKTHPLVLCGDEGVRGLYGLRENLARAVSLAGIKKITSNFTPHVTLLYDQRLVDDRSVDPLVWEVESFMLLCRHVDQGRPYTILGKWPLQDSAEQAYLAPSLLH